MKQTYNSYNLLIQLGIQTNYKLNETNNVAHTAVCSCIVSSSGTTFTTFLLVQLQLTAVWKHCLNICIGIGYITSSLLTANTHSVHLIAYIAYASIKLRKRYLSIFCVGSMGMGYREMSFPRFVKTTATHTFAF